MEILTLQLNNFRNYVNSLITFKSGLNFIVGANAQGKTNLLESIYLSSVGKSPKTTKTQQLIKFGEEKTSINLNFLTVAGKKNIKIFLDKHQKKSIKLNNLNILKLTELVGVLSVVYFSPDELKLIKEVPEDRRNFLDISISQFDKPYLYELIKYNQILKQRNSILKSNQSNSAKIEQLDLFTPQLVNSAEKIIIKRLKFIQNLCPIANRIHKQITLYEDLQIEYSFKPNGSIKQTLYNQLKESLNKELELGFTTVGPHRDDIEFKIDNKDCKLYSSQGQQRTVALVVKLSLMEIIKNEINEYPVLLLDDVLSELDLKRQNRLLNLLTSFQTLITCTDVPKTELPYNQINIQNGTVVN